MFWPSAGAKTLKWCEGHGFAGVVATPPRWPNAGALEGAATGITFTVREGGLCFTLALW